MHNMRNTSQVERTKKRSRIDSENKSGKRNNYNIVWNLKLP